jgi:hypothetical protein
MALKTHGTMAVDWESRIDFDRLRRERLQKAKDLLKQSSMGALLCFDMNNGRRTKPTASPSSRKMMSPSSGISAPPPSIIN